MLGVWPRRLGGGLGEGVFVAKWQTKNLRPPAPGSCGAGGLKSSASLLQIDKQSRDKWYSS